LREGASRLAGVYLTITIALYIFIVVTSS